MLSIIFRILSWRLEWIYNHTYFNLSHRKEENRMENELVITDELGETVREYCRKEMVPQRVAELESDGYLVTVVD